MILLINAASPETMTLALLNKKGGVLAKKKIEAKYKQSEKLLVGIERMIETHCNASLHNKKQRGWAYSNTPLQKLEGIIAVKGPGSFTALRIGLTTANVMAFALGIPIIGVMDGELNKVVEEGMGKLGKAKVGSYVMPEYGMEPNITVKKAIPPDFG